MENATILSGLVKRRADIMADLIAAQERVQSLHFDLASMDAVIRQFDPAYPIGNIRPHYRRAQAPAEFGSMSRAVLDHLRAGPQNTNEIADKIIAERALNAADVGLVRNIRKRVGMALRYQRTNGLVTETEPGDGGRLVTWAVAGVAIDNG